MEDSNLDFRYVMLRNLDISREKMVALFASSGDPDQTPHSVVPDLGLHYLPITLFRFSRLQWVKATTAADDIFKFFFLFFKENNPWRFMWTVCLADASYEISTYFLWKIMKKYTECHLLQILLRAIRVTPIFPYTYMCPSFWTIHFAKKSAGWVINSIELDQMVLSVSNLSLHYLHMSTCSNT